MLTNADNRQVFLCLVLCVGGITALARVDHRWSYKRSKVVSFRPAFKNNQTQLQHNNQTHTSAYNNYQQQPNNRTQFNPTTFRPVVSNPQPSKYGQTAFNQTRSSWQQTQTSNYAAYPAYGQQTNFNQTRPSWQQPQAPNYMPYPAYGSQAFPNQTRPSTVNYPHTSQGYFNQTRLPLAPKVSNYPQYSASGQQSTFNQTLPVWGQPSAPQLPNYTATPLNSNSWPSSRNQTNLYPNLSNSNLQQQPPSVNGAVPQGPHNWHSGGQAVLSYGTARYPLPAENSNKKVPVHTGSSNPYAYIFN